MELSVERALWTAVVYHEDYREDAALAAAGASVQAFATQPSVGVPQLRLLGPGVFGFSTGEVRCTRELMGAAASGVGWAAAVDWLIGAMEILAGATVSGLRSHGSLDPHRILVQYDGDVQIIGFGLPRLDLVDFLDDPTLLPVGESLRFTAPESLEGTAEDVTTDLFILGLIAFELATGTPVYAEKDAQKLLAQAADGEGRAAIADRDVPDAVRSWLGPMLEPWPDERPTSLQSTLKAARACRSALTGPGLGEAMEAHGEIASAVEVDLPRGWKLPDAQVLEGAVDPEVFEAERAERVDEARSMLPPLEDALKGVDKALAKLATPSDWSDTPEAEARRAEARSQGDRARQGAREARDVVSRMEKAADEGELAALAETLDEAVAQARGGAEEGERTARLALELRETAVAERAEAEARQAEANARREALAKARGELKKLQTEAKKLTVEGPAPAPVHGDVPAVATQLERRADAADDLEAALAAVSGMQIEDGDDPEAVLDAARGHLDAARRHRDRLDVASKALTDADRDAQQALDAAEQAEKEAVAIHRAELAKSGERVAKAVAALQTALDAAEAGAVGFEDELAQVLAPLQERAKLLRGRQANWTAMAGDADGDRSAAELEDLVHTGNAEADFAEADLDGLDALVAAFEAERTRVSEARAAYEKQRTERLERAEKARASLAEAETAVGLAEAFQVPKDVGEDPIEAELEALGEALGPARDALDAADAVVIDTDGMPDGDAVEALEGHAKAASSHAHTTQLAFEVVKARIEAIRKERLAAEEAHRAAVEQAHALQAELAKLLVERTPPDPEADGDVAARLEKDRQAVVQAQAAFPQAPQVAIDDDPAAAIGLLETALDGARRAADQLAKAEANLAKRTEAVRELVAQLAEVAANAEALADQTATLAGQAGELRIDPKGRWPALQPQVQALAEAITAVEAQAKEASDAAEASASADDIATAKAEAERTKKAHTQATGLLKTVREQAKALEKAVKAAQDAQAEEDRAGREAAVARAGELAAEAGTLLEALDAAIQRAGELLENSPSAAARKVWEDAEPSIDATQERLAGVEKLRAAVAKAGDRDRAERALAKIVEAVEPARKGVEGAVAAAERAGELAAAETEANIALHEGLHKEAEEVAEHLRFIHTAVEHGQTHGGVKGVPQLVAKLEQQLAYAQDGAAAVAAGIAAVNDADGDGARTEAAEQVRNQIARVVAAKNTARALQEQLDGTIEAAAKADAERRVDAQKTGAQRVEVGQQLLEQARAAADGVANLREHAHLEEPLAALDAALVACEPIVGALATLGNQLEAASDAKTAVGLLTQIQARHDELVAARATSVKAAETVQAAHQAHEQALAEERRERIERHRAAVGQVREVHRLLAGKLGEIEAEAAQADELAVDVDDDVGLIRDEVGRLALYLDGLPGELGPKGLEAALEVMETLKDARARVESALESVRMQLQVAHRAAEALAGIRGAALAVRKRYKSLEKQLDEAREGLARVTEQAPVAGASADHRDSAFQLEELTVTLADANTSLDDLNNATDADEAQALLEVAEASLDIAGSLFEFALPMVKRTIEAGEAEVQAALALLERREVASAALATALQDLPDAEHATARVRETHEATAPLEDAFGREPLDQALDALDAAHQSWKNALAPLAEAGEPPDELEALEARASEANAQREALAAAEQALEQAIVQVRDAIGDVQLLNQERAERVARALEQLDAHRKALGLVQEQAASRLSEARAQAAKAEVPSVAEALAAVEAQATSIAALEIDRPETTDPDEAEAALLTADMVLDTARQPQLDEHVAALNERVQTALRERGEREALLVGVRQGIEADLAALKERQQAFADALPGIEAEAEPWPLETLESIEALRAAASAVASLAVPQVPELPDEPTPERVEALQGIQARLRTSLETASSHDLQVLLQAVRQAITEGEEAAAEEREALEMVRDRVQRASKVLSERQARAAEMLLEASDLMELSEVAEVAAELKQSVETFTALTMPQPVPDELEEAVLFADQAESVARTQSDHADLLERLKQAVEQAEAERADLRDRITTASAAVNARLSMGHALIERVREQAGSERVRATLRAIEEAVEQLETVRFQVDVDALDRAGLEEAAGDADLAVQAVAVVDLEGLEEEADAAIQKDQAEAERVEAERASTQEKASAAVDAALLQLTMEVEARRDAVAELVDGAAGQRQRAGEALEAAQAIMANLEQLQARLQQPLPMAEAVSASFDAESQAEIAIQHLDTVDEAVKSAQDENQALARVRGQYPRIASRITEQIDSAEEALRDAPEPEGEAARAIADVLAGLGRELAAARSEAESCVAALEQATSSLAAEADFERLRGLSKQVQGQTRDVRQRAHDLVEANDTEQQLQAARRAEAFAEGRRRAELALKRAETAANAVGGAITRVHERAEGLADAEAARTELAAANEAALEAVDQARNAVSAAEDDLEAVEEAVKAADAAEAALARAEAAESEVGLLIEAARQADAAEAARRQAEILGRRDELLPGLQERLAAVGAEVDEGRTAAGTALGDEEAEQVRQHVLSTLEHAVSACETARERVGLLTECRAEDVDDFLEDAEQAVVAAEQSLGAVRSGRIQLDEAGHAAALRGRALAIEEARGRAWEACQLAQTLAKDLTLARNALPPLPNPAPPEFREAADRLAEVERRLWRAGQRADEARERAGMSDELEAVQQAVEAAETAIGSARRWEKEIDAALDQLSNLLKGPGYTEVREVQAPEEPEPEPEKQSRIDRLRRGRHRPEQTDARERLRQVRDSRPPFAAQEQPPEDAGTSPTERLLQRLRKGRQRGETGRERLKRLREQRRSLVTNDPEATEFPDPGEMEDLASTRSAADHEVQRMARESQGRAERRERRKGLLGAMKRKQEEAADEGRTQVFTREQLDAVADDAATQMFTRDMLSAQLDDDDDQDDPVTRESDGPPVWVDDDGSTKFSTTSPSTLAEREDD